MTKNWSGLSKHRKSGDAGKSPKMRHKMKMEAEKKSIKNTTLIKNPFSSISELMKRK